MIAGRKQKMVAVVSYMADFNKMGVMCCCGEEHLKITKLVYFAESTE